MAYVKFKIVCVFVCECLFVSLCMCLSECISLCIPTPQYCFTLETDASNSGVGAVLSVERNGDRCPVAFYSGALHGAQRNYSAQELEGLAVYQAINHFSYYLYGKKFTVITDHYSLRKMMEQPQGNNRILRWALKLSNYRFEVIYRPGKRNQVADGFSRIYEDEAEEEDQQQHAAKEKVPAKEEGGRCGVPAINSTSDPPQR